MDNFHSRRITFNAWYSTERGIFFFFIKKQSLCRRIYSGYLLTLPIHRFNSYKILKSLCIFRIQQFLEFQFL